MSVYLDVRTALTTIQDALVDTIQLAYGWRVPGELADVEALRSAPTVERLHRELRFVRAEGICYRFYQDSLLPHNPPFIVQPADRGVSADNPQGRGRWLRTNSQETLGPAYFRPLHRVRTGYARAVQLFQGEKAEMLERALAVSPLFMVEFLGDDWINRSTTQGAIYEVNYDFMIWCRSENFRPNREAILGSKYDAADGENTEAELDPGINKMVGDLRYLLGGNRLSLAPGVKYVDIQGKTVVEEEDLAERVFIWGVPVTVRASVNILDEDLLSPFEVWVQTLKAGTAERRPFDLDNFVQHGLLIDPGSGLVGAPQSGVATVAGQIVSVAPGAHLFEAEKDTYRDLRQDGSLIYQSVAIDDRPPTQEPNTLRVAKTRTDATDIIADVYACDFAVRSGDAFRIP